MMNEDFYDRLVRASDYSLKPGDAILVYKPDPKVKGTEELLLCMIHKALSDELCNDMLPILRTVARSSVAGGRRNKAAGTEQVPQYKKDGSRGKYRSTPKIDDPLLKEEDRIRLRGAKDGTVGSLPPTVTAGVEQECRLSAWTKDHEEETQQLMPFVKEVNKAFRKYAAKEFDNQLGAALKSRPWLLADPDFYSVFSTITVNRSWQTASHTDKGDLKEGLGVLCALGEFKGSHLIFPKFRTAVEFGQGDILLADVGNEVHGNSALLHPDGTRAQEFNKPERIACVFYFQEKLQSCPVVEAAAESVEK